MTARALTKSNARPGLAHRKPAGGLLVQLLAAALSLLRRAPHDNDKGRETW
jgi:hypothetical protein